MGEGDDNSAVGNLPAGLGDSAAILIDSAAKLDGAVILFDHDDNVVWVNDRQRQILPCSDYNEETYEGLFWRAFHAGFLGNAGARERPAEFLALAAIERRAAFAQTVNEYAGLGRVALTHRRLSSGHSIQLRFPIDNVDASDPEAVLMAAVIATRDAAAMRYALDRVATGVVILDDASRLLYANAAAHEIVDQGALVLDGAMLRPTNPDDWGLWFRGLDSAKAGERAPVMMLRDAEGSVAAAITFGPGHHPDTALGLVARLDAPMSADVAAALSRLGLSKSQAGVLELLAVGRTVEEIARQRGGSEKTVHIHLGDARKRLRANDLVVDSHVQLANLVLAIAAITRAPSGAK